MRKIIVMAVAVIVLGGCASISWTLGGQQYPTAEAAISAGQAQTDEVVDRVTPLDDSLARSAVILIPTTDYLEKHAVSITGEASDEQISYIAKVYAIGLRGIADAIKKRNIFKQVSIQTFASSYPTSSSNHAYLIWLEADSPVAMQWMITTGGNISEASGIDNPPASNLPYMRTMKILDEISGYVKSHPELPKAAK